VTSYVKQTVNSVHGTSESPLWFKTAAILHPKPLLAEWVKRQTAEIENARNSGRLRWSWFGGSGRGGLWRCLSELASYDSPLHSIPPLYPSR